MTPVQLFHRNREAHAREPAQQSTQRELALHPSQRCAETEVNAVTERQMARVLPSDVKYFGSRVVVSVSVRRRQVEIGRAHV